MRRCAAADGQAGFTLVELLVALAISAMIAGFIIGGLDLTRRAWIISRDRDGAAELDSATEQLHGLLARTVPANIIDASTRMAHLLFEGHGDSLTFVTLSEATTLPGGYMRVRLIGHDELPTPGRPGAVVVHEAVFRADPSLITEAEPVALFRGVTGFSLQYFGAEQLGQAPHWNAEWLGRDRLPLAVLIQIDVIDRNETRRILLQVPLRLAAAD